MKLESVRELKQMAAKLYAAPEAMAVGTRRSFAVSAQDAVVMKQRTATMAVGVAATGKNEFKLALRLQQRAMEGSREVEFLTQKAKGEVDIRYVGRITKQAVPWHQKRQRPLLIGASVGHHKITAGTLGCFVVDRKDGWLFALSNNHVLGNENLAKPDDEIIQPGQADDGRTHHDRIGGFERMVKFKPQGDNTIDAALAWLDDDIEINPRKLTGLGTLKGLGPEFIDEGADVAKVGRTTGLTRGRVTAFELDNVVVDFDMGLLSFDNQIEIEGAGSDAFCQGGDSGSLIVNDAGEAVALLFAGGDQGGSNGKGLTYANPIHTVLNTLKVDLYTG